MTQKEYKKLEAKSNKKQDELLLLVSKKDRKEANILLLDIVDLEIQLEAECNK